MTEVKAGLVGRGVGRAEALPSTAGRGDVPPLFKCEGVTGT